MNYWKQQATEPLFPDVLWSRPETRQGAGKLLIIGGQAQEFLHVAESFSGAEKAGAGTIRVLMPDSTKKVTNFLPEIEYATSNNSGSFAKSSLDQLMDAAAWADGVLLAGDLGRNSETGLMLDSFITKYKGLLILSGLALPSLPASNVQIANRSNTIVCIDFQRMQKLAIELQSEKPLTTSQNNSSIADAYHSMTADHAFAILCRQEKTIWTSFEGQVVTTYKKEISSLSALTAYTAVWGMQIPNKLSEALATAAYCS